MFRIIIVISLIGSVFINAKTLKIGVVAGYKKMLIKVIKEYERDSNKKLDSFFGNLRQISTQAKQTDISLLIGDKNFLQNKSGLDIKSFIPIGKGRVVIAYAKGTKPINKSQDLLNGSIKKIAMPQPKKAIYGIAGEEFLKNEKLYKRLKGKLYIVATVPQSLTYLITKEVDASIVNLTSAIENRDKIGGYLEVNPKSYKPIKIVVAKLKFCNKECQKFIEFLQKNSSKKIFRDFGL